MNVCKNCGAPITRVWLDDSYSTLIHFDDDLLVERGENCADGSGNYADTDRNI